MKLRALTAIAAMGGVAVATTLAWPSAPAATNPTRGLRTQQVQVAGAQGETLPGTVVLPQAAVEGHGHSRLAIYYPLRNASSGAAYRACDHFKALAKQQGGPH